MTKFSARETAIRRTEKPHAAKSAALKGREEYHVLFLFFPNPLSSIALAMTSMRSIEEIMRGKSIADAFVSLFTRLYLRDAISRPLAC